jgi:hypothetical protein
VTARMLALDLRRGPAPLLVLALLGLGGAGVLGDAGACDGQWPQAVLSLRQTLAIVVPCVLAAGVWHGGTARRRGVDEAIAAGARPAWQRTAIEGGSIGLAGLGAFVLLLGALTVGGGCTSGLPTGTSAASAIVTVLALQAAAFAGLALGRLASAPMAAPLVLFGGLAVTMVLGGWSQGSGAATLVLPTVDEAVRAHELTVRISAGQILWFGGLAVSGWLSASRWPARFPPARLAPAVAGLAALAALTSGETG